MAEVKVGEPAPNFNLKSSEGKTVSLQDYRGKKHVVLIFYPGDQTPGCTKQLCSARDDTKAYEQAGAVVFGVNQGSEESHVRFVEKHKLTTPLLVDTNLLISKEYDAVMGFGPLKLINRTVVVIDPAGKIVFYKRGMPNTSEIIASFSNTASVS